MNMKYRIRLKNKAVRLMVRIAFVTLIIAFFAQAQAAYCSGETEIVSFGGRGGESARGGPKD